MRDWPRLGHIIAAPNILSESSAQSKQLSLRERCRVPRHVRRVWRRCAELTCHPSDTATFRLGKRPDRFLSFNKLVIYLLCFHSLMEISTWLCDGYSFR